MPCTKINSKWLKVLYIRHDTIKLPEESIGEEFSEINYTSVFLGPSLKAIEIKTKINKGDPIKFTNFCTGKETIKQQQQQQQQTKWKKIFSNDGTDKDLTSKIYKLIQLSNQTRNKTTQYKNRQKTLIDISSKTHTIG